MLSFHGRTCDHLLRLLFAACAGLALLGAAPAQGADPTYTNPVLDQDFPDPAALKVGNLWYAFATGAAPEDATETPYIRMATSPDLVHWSAPVTVMARPDWANGSTWAPHVVRDPARPDRFVMFFSARADPDRRIAPAGSGMCIGVAVAAAPGGPYRPQPRPLVCGPGFAAIDPMAFEDSSTGAFTLFWGSGRSAILARPLAADLLGFARGSRPKPVLGPVAGDRYADLIEGSWVLDHGGYRYLFTSGSNCCAGPDDYAVTVARRRLDGRGGWERFRGGDHGAILKAGRAWAAPGHNGVLVDGAGRFWLIYHARHPDDPRRRVLLIDPIAWIDGWPRIAGDSPSLGAVPAPVP